ncbi:pyridoxal phosphate-dependent aminotransferase [Thermodesulfobacteriota bacterium]
MPILAARVGQCVSLGQGVPSFPTPPHIVEAVYKALKDDPASGKYSLQTGLPELRWKIAETLHAEKGIDAEPESEILVTVGAMEGLMATILTLVDRGDEVILPSPTYASFIEQVHLAEGVPVFVPLKSENWGLDMEKLRQAVTSKTRVVVLCNPGNPTGAVFADDSVRALCELALGNQFVIISDETYDYMTYDVPTPLSPASLPEFKENVVSVFLFRKSMP